MKILIIGASRGIGLALVQLALERGHEVTALLRNPAKMNLTHPHLTLVQGDIRNPASLAETVSGQAAVCVCVGIPPSRKPVDTFSQGAKNLIVALANHPQTKLISVTGIGAGESRGHGGFFYDRLLQPLLLKEIFADKDREEALVKASKVDWMIVRPGFLTNGPCKGQYRVITDLAGVTAGKISRADVADFMLNQLQHPTMFHQTPLLTY